MADKVETPVVEKQEETVPVEGAAKEGGENASKKAQKKLEKEQEKERKRLEREAAQLKEQEENWLKELKEDTLKENYGDYILVQSQEKTDRKWIQVLSIDESMVGQTVLIRARLQNSRVKGNVGFLVLRQQFSTIQAMISKNDVTVSKTMVKWVGKVPCESIVDVYGVVSKPETEIKSTSCKLELIVNKVYVVSRSRAQLPFQLEDAARQQKKEEQLAEYNNNEGDIEESKDNQASVSIKTRLDNRIIDLRTPAKQAIFRLQSGICQLFREYLLSQDFVEIHTPKLIGGSSEGGANIFKLKYFDKDACLAQSPQLYKQMCIQSDFERVFEIGPVFRAEKSFTHRHMCEFTGLDIEMSIKENYHELLDLMGDLFVHIFKGLETKYSKEIEAIQQQFPFEPFKIKTPVVKLTFEEGCKLLKEAGIEQNPLEDLDTVTEKKLGDIVREKYDTDFYMLHRYPISARPFYTMLCHDDPNYTLSYDFFMRGQEITSGAQRNHDPVSLAKRAAECGINVETIKDYIESMAFGAYPHGGCGIGLERVVFLYCDLYDIRNGCLFPRDPKRIAP
ncbi:aspartyl-tRNA synthetase protein (macronuclear) [Tetrahymena thermophila SB210]|uniref:aspartate--tRNA ligase n=1 Tax=Tetrahymena thermophila (strain SB210) TaxID=312017 RepID=I7M3W6_TETTS|nr:aspartyl-tRNA synthetase protein [Tetrahymena thermophila SB210]EAS04430.2 aspartyl-tRNA synthetase protein [Tetrahymena thermophila SB210]|eukprot:XP_001024675.2 aspartyl-tRNA synthetase protein [Tetrahymena thermophila SB210]